MSATTGIEWTDSTWNPIRGCTRVSEGCRNCYAESVAYRFSKPGQPYEGLAVLKNGHASWTGKIEFVENHLLDPLKWKLVTTDDRDPVTGINARRRRIFVNSMSDLFHEGVTHEMRDRIFAVMALCPEHVFQVLTKRPERMLAYLGRDRSDHWLSAALDMSKAPMGFSDNCVTPLENVWLGTSVENQAAADERIPLLLKTPAAVQFISAEPLLGRVMLPRRVYLPRAVRSELPFVWPALIAPAGQHVAVSNPHGALSVHCEGGQLLGIKPDEFQDFGPGLDWVICGGESGPGARPMHPDWARSLRDQCQAAGVPFFFKQWGEWLPVVHLSSLENPKKLPECMVWLDGRVTPVMDPAPGEHDGYVMRRVGKKAAGAKLDGVEWKQFPEGR